MSNFETIIQVVPHKTAMKLMFKNPARTMVILICAAVVFSGPKQAWAEHFTPTEFIADLGDRAVRTLADQNLSEAEKQTRFRDLLLEGFDVRTLSRFAVGRYWRKAGKTQRAEYRVLFTDYVVQTYTARFSQYSGERLQVTDDRAAGKKDIIVKSQLLRPKGAAVKVEWRVRQRKHKWLIIDIIVEGVSMAITQRDEFASVIRRGGGDFGNLLTLLKEKTNPE